MHRLEDSEQDQAEGGGCAPLSECDRKSCGPKSVSHHHDVSVSNNLYDGAAEKLLNDAPGLVAADSAGYASKKFKALYTPEQRVLRDSTKWTLVQGVLAPIQFLIFLISLGLVIRYLATGDGFAVATGSVVVKTLVLYTIMITGAIWEREVFGCYLFAPAFFWEDVFSFLVLALHTAYLVMLFAGFGDPQQQMLVALAAYASYVVNATQFLLKLRAARLDERNHALAVSNVTGSRA